MQKSRRVTGQRPEGAPPIPHPETFPRSISNSQYHEGIHRVETGKLRLPAGAFEWPLTEHYHRR